MPAKMHRALKAEAAKRGYTGKKADKYVYGGMRARGWKPKKEKK